MNKCPYCYEDFNILPKDDKCPYCASLLGGECVTLNYPSVDRKKCIFCGESVAKEAIYCRYCHKSIGDVEKMVQQLEELEREDNDR